MNKNLLNTTSISAAHHIPSHHLNQSPFIYRVLILTEPSYLHVPHQPYTKRCGFYNPCSVWSLNCSVKIFAPIYLVRRLPFPTHSLSLSSNCSQLTSTAHQSPLELSNQSFSLFSSGLQRKTLNRRETVRQRYAEKNQGTHLLLLSVLLIRSIS